MAEEAKIKVKLETADAERGVQKIDSGFKRATSSAGKFAAISARAIGGLAAAGVALGVAGTPGATNALGITGGALTRSGADLLGDALGLDGAGQAVSDSINRLEKQQQLTASALGPLAAGAISEAKLNEVFDSFKPLAELQQRGETRLSRLITTERVAGAALGAVATSTIPVPGVGGDVDPMTFITSLADAIGNRMAAICGGGGRG